MAFLVGGELGAVGGYIGTNREGCKLRHVDMRMAHSRRRGFISHQLGTSRPTLRAGHQRFNPSMRIMRPLVLFRHAYMDHRPTRGSPWNFSRTDSTKNICSRSVFDLLFVDFGLFGQALSFTSCQRHLGRTLFRCPLLSRRTARSGYGALFQAHTAIPCVGTAKSRRAMIAPIRQLLSSPDLVPAGVGDHRSGTPLLFHMSPIVSVTASRGDGYRYPPHI